MDDSGSAPRAPKWYEPTSKFVEIQDEVLISECGEPSQDGRFNFIDINKLSAIKKMRDRYEPSNNNLVINAKSSLVLN